MITVELKNVRFHAFHGLYAEEQKSGSDYDINLSVSWEENKLITELDETVNYARLHALVKEEMKKPRRLLETLLAAHPLHIESSFSVV